MGGTGGDALRAGRAGRFVRYIRCVRGVFVDGVPPSPFGEGSRDPARPPFGLPHSGGVLVCETSPPKSFRRSNGGDWTEGLTRNRLEHSPPRRHYFTPSVFLQHKGRK